MVAEETADREALRLAVPAIRETLVEEDCPEDQYQCCVCKGFCYLSQITCSCTKFVSCIQHASQLCSCDPTKRTLRMRYSENQLEQILEDITTRAAIPEQWRTRFENLLEAPRPPLKSLRALLADGEKIEYDLPEVADLRALVDRSNAWVERVATLATRKSTGRRRKGGRKEDVEEDFDRSPEALNTLLEEAKLLAFESDEIKHLRQIILSISTFRNEANAMLEAPEASLDVTKCKNLLIVGNSLNVDLPEIGALTTLVNRLLWFHKVEEEVDDRTLQIGDIVALLDEAKVCNIPADHPTMVELRQRESKGTEWKSKAESLLKAKDITIDKISELVDDQEYTPVSIDLMRQLENVRKTASNWQSSASNILSFGGSVIAATRLCKAVRTASGALKYIDIPEIEELQIEVDAYTQWQADLASALECKPSKANDELKKMVLEMQCHLDPADDRVSSSDKFTCFCRRPKSDTTGGTAGQEMLQCYMCESHYHVRCVGKAGKNAAYACEMCAKPELMDIRPSLQAVVAFVDPAQWRWRITSTESGLIEEMIALAKRYSTVVLPIMNPFDQVQPCRDTKLIEHHLRKLYNVPIRLDFRHGTQLFIVEDWLDSRLDQAIKHNEDNAVVKPEPKARRRRAIFGLPQAKPMTFQCLCNEPPNSDLTMIPCQKCGQMYHSRCLRPMTAMMIPDPVTGKAMRDCPCCLVKQGWQFPKGSEVMIGLQMTCEHRTFELEKERG